MVAEPSQATFSVPSSAEVPSPQLAPPLRCKYRLRFSKTGDMRLVSHHDLMHVMERMLRRAALPVAHTQGFHPQPRMVFALSLALGIAGCNEVLELELTESIDPESLQQRLAEQAPLGLAFRTVRRLEGKSSSLVRRAFYRLPLELEGDSSARAGAGALLEGRCRELLTQAHLWVERTRPVPRKLDIRPYLHEVSVENGALNLALWVTPTGTARPDEFGRLLGLDPLLHAGAFFERTDLEMMDEVTQPLPEHLTNSEEISPQQKDMLPEAHPPAEATKVAPRPTALVSGPLSFDS